MNEEFQHPVPPKAHPLFTLPHLRDIHACCFLATVTHASRTWIEKLFRAKFNPEGKNMKNQISRWIALGAFTLGFLATDQGQANFSGTSWGWPNPPSGGFDGAGHYWGGSAPNYTSGWSLARYDSSTPANLAWYGRYSLNSDSDYVTIDGGAASNQTYKVVEYYWDGATYDYGESNVYYPGYSNAQGGCD
jgi:hypothetical protein